MFDHVEGTDWLIEMHLRSGLIGSLYYGQHLSEEEADRIRFYFNYDMIGSKQPIYAVYADTDAHKTGGSILFDYLQSKGKPVYYGYVLPLEAGCQGEMLTGLP